MLSLKKYSNIFVDIKNDLESKVDFVSFMDESFTSLEINFIILQKVAINIF